MRKMTYACVLVVLGFLVATQSFASDLEGKLGKATGDHFALSSYYDEHAQIAKSKAENWDFAADYYQKFPGEVSGKMTAAEHIAHLRSVAEDLRKDEQHYRDMARKHRKMTRVDVE